MPYLSIITSLIGLFIMILSNLFSSSKYLRDPYNYESNLIGNIRMKQLLGIIESALEICPRCQLKKKNHYCIDLACKHRELICSECDVNSIDQKHYLHDYSYILPFLTKDIFGNFYKLKRKITSFHDEVSLEIKKIQDYLKQLYKVDEIVRKQIKFLQQQEERGKIRSYVQKMTSFIENYTRGDFLKKYLDDVLFLSASQCQKKEEEMKSQIITHLDNLKWPKDPQRVLKDKLKSSQEQQRKQIFISNRKAVQVTEIDSNFRANTEYLTENLRNHQVEIKLDSDLLGKPKFYQSFIYHFRDCQKLFIENGNINHLKTPLTFRNLRSLQFNFNLEAEPQNIKVDFCTEQLKELTLKRFREEDIRILKQITTPCIELRKLHLEFSNKVDLFSYKELVDFLKNEKLRHLVSFTLKIRTESEVKRLYGYLSKFTKEQVQTDFNLSKALLGLVENNSHLSRLVIEGVKPLEMPIIANKLKQLSFLMDYKIYFENVDLMTQVDDREAKYIESICFKRKRIFYALAKASKNKYYSKCVVDHIVSEYLM